MSVYERQHTHYDYMHTMYRKNLKLLVIGHARHGKDTVSEILRDKYSLSFESSSRFCSKKFIYNRLKDVYNYSSEEQCYEDRHNHRSEWYDLICEFNTDDPSRLGRAIFAEYNVYCGLRNKKEFYALKNSKAFDYAIWVDRSDVLPLEDPSSMTLHPWMADFIIDNNGSLKNLEFNVGQLVPTLYL